MYSLSLDIFGEKWEKPRPKAAYTICRQWTAVIRKHPAGGGKGVEVWRRSGMRTESNAIAASEAEMRKAHPCTG